MATAARVWVKEERGWEIVAKGQQMDENVEEEKEPTGTLVGVLDLRNNASHIVCIPDTATVATIKAKLEPLCGLKPKHQKLFAASSKGRFLEDTTPIKSLQSSGSNGRLQLLLAGQAEVCSLRRLEPGNSTWYYPQGTEPDPVMHSGSIDAVAFSVNKPITVAGIGLSNAPESRSYDTWFGIAKGNPDDSDFAAEVLASDTISWQATTDQDTTYQALFTTPVPIEPGTTYTLGLLTVGEPSYYGIRGENEVTDPKTGVTFEFEEADASSNCTDVNSGQIQVIHYYV